MSKIRMFPGNKDGRVLPEVILQGIAEELDQIEGLYVVARTKDGYFIPWATDTMGVPEASFVLQDLAMKHVRGEIEPEDSGVS